MIIKKIKNKKLKLESAGSESHLNQEQTKDPILHLEQNIYLTACAIKEYTRRE